MDELVIHIEGLWVNYYGQDIPPAGQLPTVPADMTLTMRVTYPDGTTASVSSPLASDEIDAVNDLLAGIAKRVIAGL